MKGSFRVKLFDNSIVDYDNFDDIPPKFFRLLKYNPDYPPSPHSEEDHKMIEAFDDKLHELLRRESNGE
jgi:hypothetical protein|tara:strand:+ start:418 stop:624 length:207 start_codon:yes stop_codon:yes gene_type:complete